jgi:protein tyrosine phosphatase (PTP) superfamily phosphohydrolase (DUF442 family)
MKTRLAARTTVFGLVVLVVQGVLSCAASDPAPSSRQGASSPVKPGRAVASAMPSLAENRPEDYRGVHNVVAYHAGLLSGSQPDGEAGFDTLAAMGVKTIISVDGAEPEVEKARARGIRYIHLPISYNGIDEHRALEIARATRDAMREGPVYIHCHHGKHRSAAAAAMAVVLLGWASPEEGVARMKVSGTAPEYAGLFRCVESARAVDARVLDSVPADFPSVSRPSGFVQGMVEVDRAFEHLREIEKAGWRTPASSPDLVPSAEAGRLADLYRVLRETDYARRRPGEMSEMLRDAEAGAQALENLLVAGERDSARLSAQFRRVADSCRDCHVKYRN